MKVRGVHTLIGEARTCALVMLGNACYIERELERVQLPDDLRAQTVEICSNLIGTKHDVISELSELDDILAAPTLDFTLVASRIERIVRWLSDDLPAIHALVTALHSASAREPQYGAACVLVTESAANILNALNQVSAAAVRLQGE